MYVGYVSIWPIPHPTPQISIAPSCMHLFGYLLNRDPHDAQQFRSIGFSHVPSWQLQFGDVRG